MDGLGLSEVLVYLQPYCDSKCVADIKSSLYRNGCIVNSIEQLGEINTHSQSYDASVFLCIVESNTDFDFLQQSIATIYRHLPILGVFNTADSALTEHLLPWCKEFVYWPCREIELARRIERMLTNRNHGEERRKAILDRRISHYLDASYKDTKSRYVADFEKKYLCWILAQTHGNVTHAAERVGKERRALGKLLKKYNIDKSQYYITTIN